jgi:plastocyanin
MLNRLRLFTARPTSRLRPAGKSLAIVFATACSSLAPGAAVPISEEPVSSSTRADSGSGENALEDGSARAHEGGVDAGTSIPTGPSLNGCAQSSYVDRSGPNDDRNVYFGTAGTSGPFTFSPACMVVSPGQSVTFNGDFSIHPLSPGSNPEATTTGTSSNPIQPHDADDMAASFTFKASGTFPFFCQNHYASGMYGAVRVR